MPRTSANLTALRECFSQIMGDQKDNFRSIDIPPLLARLGLEDCPEADSKRKHLSGGVSVSSDQQIVLAAQEALRVLRLNVHERDTLQELIWSDGSCPVIPARYRRDLAQSLEAHPVFIDEVGFQEALGALWRIDEGDLQPDFSFGPTLRDLIVQHFVRNEDWSVAKLFEVLGAFKCSDSRFTHFLESLASSRVRPDESSQLSFMAVVDSALAPCGVHFVATMGDDGYLDPALVYIGAGGKPAPKNLIFASSVKPDLRLSNALDNDVEVMTCADKVLIYDRPIGHAGLLWRDLQSWYEEKEGLDAGEGKRPLYRRLNASLKGSSKVQSLAFTSFYKAFPKDNVPNLPALLPEVWFHWDPQTVAQRGKDALLRSRMDFLLLLPGGIRIVIEVDGQHHYATDDGRASPKRYSDMVAADRLLRLSGYEVYRFGGYELFQSNAEEMLIQFYRALFDRYDLL
ncbi:MULTISPECIES: hypothetical protein [unclassified Pseudomonas]|uniref:AbiJ-related protein n=1 Tax=unclassified Pseudomonas TaxID=196821 RepID=UPI000B725606|nr:MULTISPECIES: hypothetical protein [unclassified Pseudomonas]SNS89068.1 hypothetical protein SAMN05660216_01922 [Pseudomonas sp. LAMO17WK12:I8]SNY18411.1 hypothetical protein SAMN05660893_01772 [Pseudomonas sp. LAMO17WK12:I12]SNY19315.1 hypothetical protein SAMN05660344_01925 [Pseudomonas sp. LAMO17WK12:I11]SNY19342.1 hypothetical protein SAMN05660700_01925 [Pseudomonas sp. LAMO17WK12:I7]